MATSTLEITPTYMRSFAEKSVRAHIGSDTKYQVFTTMQGIDVYIVTTTFDTRRFKVTRDSSKNEIRLFGDGIKDSILL